MKLFKNNRFLQKFFFIELVLIVSGISSFIILAYVKTNPGLTQPDPGSVTGKHQFLFKNYGILAYFLALPNTLFNSPDDSTGIPEPQQIEDKFIADVLTLKNAETLLDEKKYARAENLIVSMRDSHDFMATKKTKLHLQTLYLQQKYSQFLERCDAFPNTGNLQIQLLRINCLSKTNEDEKAFELFKKLFLKNRLSPFNRAIASRTLSRFLQKLSYDDWFRKFQYLARRNLFSEFLKERRYIKSPQLHNLFYAEFYYKQRRYSSVLKRLASVKSPKLLDHKKKLILKIEIRRRDYSNIFPVLEELEDEPSLYEELLFDAASILLIHRQLDLSLSLLSKYINFMEVQKAVNRPGSNYWKALWLSAWIHYRENREEKALRYFEKGLRSGSDSYKMASTYWYHRLNETDADDAASQIARFPFSYYYAKTAGPGPDDGIAGLKRFITLINEKQSPSFFQQVAHLKSLLKNRLIDESFAFIQWAKTTETLNESDQNVFKLIQSILHLKKGDFYHTFVEFRKNFDCYQELRLPRFLHAIYTPVRYRELVETYSEKHRLDKNLVFALIWQESFFRRDIVSPARANGLMQLMYPTARQIARRQGIRIKRWDLYTPHINIRLGTDHLRELLDKYDNKLHLVLAAYNAGPHRVDSWLKQFGHVSDDEFIELMPFTETRGYVKNILRNYYYYRFYYGE